MVISYSGFVALCAYVSTLVPTAVRALPHAIAKFKTVKWLSAGRREVGILSFTLSVVHGCVAIHHHNTNLLSAAGWIRTIEGMSMMLIFFALTITSNNWSVKKLQKHWKTLHNLTYVGGFLMVLHILRKMWGHWSLFTPMALVALVACLTLALWAKSLRGTSGAAIPDPAVDLQSILDSTSLEEKSKELEIEQGEFSAEVTQVCSQLSQML